MDRDQVRQVIWNLCLNAVQAVGRHGAVSVVVTRQCERGQDGVRVEVRDDGVGLAGVDSGNCFDPFETTKPNGTGLGLSMARHIVELHRGWIRLEDARPGACASFWLPVDRSAE
jgi:signal transduction histidine kinase